MASLKVYSNTGSSAGEAAISDKIASLRVNKHLIWEVIKAEQANARQGTHKTKTKAEVSGGGKKPWKQKGTGNARQGSTRSPQWRHGGIVFGPLPRDYTDGISRQKKQVGVAHILAQKVQDKKVVIYDGLNLEKPSAKAAFEVISKITEGAKLQTEGREKKKLRKNSNKARHSIAVIMSSSETKDAKSLRNIPWVKPLNSSRIAATSLFYNEGLVISKAALQELDKSSLLFYRGNMNLYDVIKKPLVSEKAESLRAQNCYVFEVDINANKTLVKQAIRKIFGVTPLKVNTLVSRSDAKANRYNIGHTPRRKKAYVYLGKNDKIALFEGV